MFEKIRGGNSICNREEKAWQHFRIEKIRNLVTRAHSPHLEGGGEKPPESISNQRTAEDKTCGNRGGGGRGRGSPPSLGKAAEAALKS